MSGRTSGEDLRLERLITSSTFLSRLQLTFAPRQPPRHQSLGVGSAELVSQPSKWRTWMKQPSTILPAEVVMPTLICRRRLRISACSTASPCQSLDYLVLSSNTDLRSLGDVNDVSLPKRGEKDFEPNPTLFQADILSASRQAMHNALAFPRLHNPKNRIFGVYSPNGPVPPSRKPLDTTSEGTTAAPVSVGAQVHLESCVYVANPKGQYFKTLGQADRWGRIWLLPEEALYLLERGSLDIRWPRCAVGEADEGDIEDSGIPMSLQAAYACFIGRGGLTMERFSVFTGLRRLGYTVIRAPGWAENVNDDKLDSESAEKDESGKLSAWQGPGLAGIFSRFLKWLRDTAPTTALGPVAGLGFHHTYGKRHIPTIPREC